MPALSDSVLDGKALEEFSFGSDVLDDDFVGDWTGALGSAFDEPLERSMLPSVGMLILDKAVLERARARSGKDVMASMAGLQGKSVVDGQE